MWSGKIEDYILYEDKNIIVCHKPAGLAVQNARIGSADMESVLKNYLYKKEPGTMPYLGIVHRLDQPVEGIIVFARTPFAAKELSRQISGGQMEKIYLAVTKEKPDKEEGVLEDYLKKDGRTNTSAVVAEGTPGAKKARLSYQVIHEETERFLIKIKLDTGRHHQIRVQMAHAGMPLTGDRKYGGGTDTALGLCACSLTFLYPGSRKKMHFTVKPKGEAFKNFSL